jgi:hypothetical protein
MRVQALHVTLLLGAFSCSPGGNDVEAISVRGDSLLLQITTDRVHYERGDVVEVRFHNTSTSVLLLNRCDGFLERQSGSLWQVIMPASDEVPCRDVLEGLKPQASLTRPFDLAARLDPGTYRIRFSTALDSRQDLLEERNRVTNIFTVR